MIADLVTNEVVFSSRPRKCERPCGDGYANQPVRAAHVEAADACKSSTRNDRHGFRRLGRAGASRHAAIAGRIQVFMWKPREGELETNNEVSTPVTVRVESTCFTLTGRWSAARRGFVTLRAFSLGRSPDINLSGDSLITTRRTRPRRQIPDGGFDVFVLDLTHKGLARKVGRHSLTGCGRARA
jgi:hypothetical protein